MGHPHPGGWLLVFLGIFFIFFLFAALSIPRYTYTVVAAKTSNACVDGEHWDGQLCAPNTPTPVPIVSQWMKHQIAPCTSFYHHMCGEWMETHQNQDLAFTYAYHRNQATVHRIVTDPNSGAAYALYRSCLDTMVHNHHSREDTRQRNYVLQQVVDSFQTLDDLPVALGRLNHYGFTSPFTMSVEKHPTHPTLVPLFRADVFSFDVRDEAKVADFFQRGKHEALPPQRMRDLLSMLDTMCQWFSSDADGGAKSYREYVQSGQADRDTYKFGALMDLTGDDVFWIEFLRQLDGHALDTMRDADELVWIIDRDYFRSFFSATFSHQQWKDYLTLSVLEGTLKFMPRLAPDAYFKAHDWAPVGKHVRLEHRLKREEAPVSQAYCVRAVHHLLPGVVANEYLHRMGGMEDARRRVTEMTVALRDTYARMIGETEWMDAVTKERAAQKVESIIVRAVHPTHWRPEPFAHRIKQDRWLRNVNMIRRYRSERNYALWKSKDPLDRDTIQRFGQPLSTVNAYYSPTTNTITVFAGILSPPFYDDRFSLMAAYARIGTVLGHELSHAMDNSGRLFDEQGNFVDWWSSESTAGFNEHAQRIVDEYGAPHGCENLEYGRQTLGEDIADIIGVTMAYRAYFDARPEASDDERREFFQSYAQQWCSHYDAESVCAQVKQDVHAIAEMRVDQTLRQMSAFADAFRCPVQSRMVNPNADLLYGKK